MGREEVTKKIRILLLIATAVTLPTKWVNLNSAMIISLCLVSGFDFIVNKRKLDLNLWIFIVFVSFFLLTLISITYSSDLPPVLSKIETRLVILAFPIILFLSPFSTKKVLDITLLSFLISCIVISVICLAWIFYSNQINGIELKLSNSWFFSSDNLVEKWGFHPNYFSIYCAFCVFIVISFWKEGKIQIWVASCLIVYLFIFEVFLASRVGLLAFAFVFILTIAYEFYVRKRLLLGLFFSVLATVIIYVVSMNSQIVQDKFDALLNRNINAYNESFRVNRRFIQWNSALEVISGSPLIGVGVGDMQDELQKIYLEKNFAEGYEYAYNPHNLFLDTGAGLGIVGISSVIILFFISLNLAVKKTNVLYCQFLVLFILISLVESTFSVQKGVTFFFLFNTLFYCSLSVNDGDKSNTFSK